MRFTLASFIKICLLSGSKQVSEVQKRYAITSGYDYYWTLYKAIAANAAGCEEDEVESILLSASNLSEAANNRAAYEVYLKRFGNKRTLSAVKKSVTRQFEDGIVEITFNPIFQTVEKSNSCIYSVWAMQTPPLEQSYAALACLMLRNAYRKTSLANSSFFFFDLVSDRIYSEKQITNSTSMVEKAELRKLAEIIRQVDN